MNAGGKLGAYGLVLAVALGGGAAIGSAAGPLDVGEADGARHEDHQAAPATDAGTEHETNDQEQPMPVGVLTSQDGYTFEADDTEVDGTADARFEFRISGPDGSAVTDFELRHERELHFIVVSRDLGTFAHLHPTLASDGTWGVQLPPLTPGAYRAFADFAPAGGPELVLGVDLAVPGQFDPAPLPEATGKDTVDGYDVELTGTPVAGSATEVGLTISRDGQPVDDLEPYLGAFGHLVAVRDGDLAYLHVHPLDEGGERGGPTVRFAVDVPSPGDYRLFFDFAHDGEVRTAAFTVSVPAGEASGGTDGNQGSHGGPGTEHTEEHQ